MSLAGALAGVMTGAATAVAWKQTPWLKLHILKYELVPVFFLSTAAIIVVSLLTQPPPDVEAQFEDMQGRKT